jgi:hypothetical protein
MHRFFICMFLMLNLTDAFHLQMSASNDYLKSLNVQKCNYNRYCDILNKVEGAKATETDQIEIDTILVNIVKIDNIFFNRNSKNIIFKLKDEMQNIYIENDNEVMKLSKNTKVFSKGFRNFLVHPFNTTYDIDAVMYKE